jgi:hypothetical protein
MTDKTQWPEHGIVAEQRRRIEVLEANLASQAECGQGWMDAYYAQTSRLIRAESALKDIVVFIKNPRKDLERRAREALADNLRSVEEQNNA